MKRPGETEHQQALEGGSLIFLCSCHLDKALPDGFIESIGMW